jgi:hypothetical protein
MSYLILVASFVYGAFGLANALCQVLKALIYTYAKKDCTVTFVRAVTPTVPSRLPWGA